MHTFQKRILSVFLALILTFSLCIPSFASPKDRVQNFFSTKTLYKLVDLIIDRAVAGINYVFPGVEWPDYDSYETENFYEGTKTFLTAPQDGAQWSLGYASASLRTGQELDGNHMVGGSLSLNKAATAIYDDQRVRTIAINDGSGRGTVVFASIDGFGMAVTDVREIRSRLEKYAKDNGIVSINVTVMHQHSCVDTYGMNGKIIRALFQNIFVNSFNTSLPLYNGKNVTFMENLFRQTVTSVKNACANMTPGKLYYGTVDASDYIRDKRTPYVNDNMLHRYRFVPDNGTTETYLVNAAIHCVGNGAAGTTVTGDYPYYMEQTIRRTTGANFIMIQGAELAITSDGDLLRDLNVSDTRLEGLQHYGNKLGELVCSIQSETEVAPLLNIKFQEFKIPVTNQILIFAANAGLLCNLALNDNGQMVVVSEIGYMEMGTDLAFALIPGELAPELAYGGALDASENWTAKDWTYPSMQEIINPLGARDLQVLGLMNDQVGYILPDTDYRSILTENEEVVATGNRAGSSVMEAFAALIESIK